jgi:SAM-dependent methyltransferase
MHTQSAQMLKEAEQRFRFLKQFDDPGFSKKTDCRDRLRASDARWFPGDYLSSAFARAMCARRAIPFKEVLESFEFYACVRKQIRAACVADLCCGHGLVGILFAMFERRVDRVILIDRVRPPSFHAVLAAASSVAPWVMDKVQFVECKLEDANDHLERGTSIVGVHACGERTDQSIGHALQVGGCIAVLPCCRHHRSHPAPPSLKQALGGDVAIDVDRTYRLFNAGYHVRWDSIPHSITPMNRVLSAVPGKNR